MQENGFTLIETLIYMALFAIIIGGAVVATYQIVTNSDRNQAKVIVSEEANFLLSKFDWALTNATAASGSGSNLQVTKSDITGNPLAFSLNGNIVQLARSGGAPVDLNSVNTKVTALNFVVSNTTPKSVTIDFIIDNDPYELIKYLRQ